jgi:SAM-dependent methyltransferase
MADAQSHWETVYKTKQPNEVSWYRPHLEMSLELVVKAAPNLDAHIIDVGAGESTLVDDLLLKGYRHLYALDLSSTAFDVTKARLGADAQRVTWLVGDVRTVPLDQHRFDVWHDRAVFHFLTSAEDRAAYVRQVAHAVKPGGHVIVATFGPEGPSRCSGLETVRYHPESLHAQFGPTFHLVEHRSELHQTPMGTTQQFTYCFCMVSEPAAKLPVFKGRGGLVAGVNPLSNKASLEASGDDA